MLKAIRKAFAFMLWMAGLAALAFLTWMFAYSFMEVDIPHAPLQFSLQKGSSLRSVTRQMEAAGALRSPWQFELLARISGDSRRIKAGSYELTGAITPYLLLRKITSGDQTEEQIV